MGQVSSASKYTRGKKFALLVELLMSRLFLPFYGGAREESMWAIPACSRGPSSAFVCDASRQRTLLFFPVTKIQLNKNV